ncbi:MAG: dehydrogenase [Bacteroidetes bacterium GWF2_42_66]|nr:MAG: dehydrogenase [Bacteroidetes bacterium GWA2_42_15]OFY01046.1 MAG: dehydrogenase [Bacteroidetes bacterium GWE2_42_39]OFY41889.1 MAG: dehydrogenase [Bacteroidetes bacterium GWF2_42_66]HBL77934.1 dehydrogenase [Prolixibacteraceae bacterium]HCR90157.1 dehydrogenase [Prolixibacteraceae bacterium]
MENDRREFIKKTVLGTAALSFGGILPGFSAHSYRNISGANERINVGTVGVNSRGLALSNTFSMQKNCNIMYVSDVDIRAAEKCIDSVSKITGTRPKAAPDFRKAMEDKDLDAMVIATPDHWHAPAALLAMKAGKHVYLEKPCSHSPEEGEILVQAASKYNKVLQMGNQRRSWPNVAKGIEALKSGVIGKPYFGKGWYTNKRPSIGVGKLAAVPDWLNWDLWQGPAPRMPFKDNYVHYNWHWFWHWGTGEALNNGTHMVDLLRWGMGVDYPIRVSSNGGRFHYTDDWETPDTQVISMDFKEGFTMTWEGRSCNARSIEGSSVGAMFYGDKGSLLIAGGNGYTVFDVAGKEIESIEDKEKIDPRNAASPAQQLDALHIQNFFDGITKGTSLRSNIDSGHKSTLLVQLGNISQRVGRSLEIDPQNGHILKDKEARKLWSREYEKGWEMTL